MVAEQTDLKSFSVPASISHQIGDEAGKIHLESGAVSPAEPYHNDKPTQNERSKKEVKERSKNQTQITNVAMNTLIDNTRWTRSHRLLFTYRYSGTQPLNGSNSLAKVGRYKTIPQARYNVPEFKAIIFTLPKRLKIWIKHPEGVKAVEQIIQARKTAWLAVQQFARKHKIEVFDEQAKRFSEHTIEQKRLDRAIRPIILENQELAKEQLGLTINHTSHKNKIHFEGRNARARVMKLEWLLDRDEIATKEDLIPLGSTLEALQKGQIAHHQDIKILLGGMGQFISVANELLKSKELIK